MSSTVAEPGVGRRFLHDQGAKYSGLMYSEKGAAGEFALTN